MKRLSVILVALLAVIASGSVFAKNAPKKSAPKQAQVAKAKAPADSPHRKTPYVGAISADARSGRVLFSAQPEAEAYPASVTKAMTLLLILEDIQAGKYSFDSVAEITPDVSYSEPSWVGLKAGDRMTVRDLCYAMMINSANDAAIALGVYSSGTLGGFVARMNARAVELGMTKTQYFNPNGLPPTSSKGRRYPWKSFNVSTASDQLKLGLALLKHPETLQFTSIKTADLIKTTDGYRVEVTRQVGKKDRTSTLREGETLVQQLRNHNNLMVKDKKKIFNPDGTEAVDGLKTGYIDAGGSSMILTGQRNGKRAVVVVLGAASADLRDQNASRLLSDALGALNP